MSDFDEIHDQFIPKPTIKKRGTKYERLVAVVIALLEKDGSVTHDVRMRGDSDVLRQIDVRLTRGDIEKRVLIECKDFDESGNEVDLAIVDRFITVVKDIGNVSEAWIVTCNGFTSEALKMAKHAGIKLAVLRRFKDEDWDGRAREITIQMIVKADQNHQLKFHTVAEDRDAFEEDAVAFGKSKRFEGGRSGLTITMADGQNVDGAVWLNEQREHFRVVQSEEGHYEATFPLPGAKVSFKGCRSYRIDGITIEYDITGTKHETLVNAGDKIATLLLRGPEDTDLVVWDEDLHRFDIDEKSGDVREKG